MSAYDDLNAEAEAERLLGRVTNIWEYASERDHDRVFKYVVEGIMREKAEVEDE